MIKLDEIISIPSFEFDVTCKKEEHGFGLFEIQGLRPTQEDAAVARWYTEEAFASLTPQEIARRLWTTYKLLNQRCCRPNFAGSTASTTVYDGKGNLITATVGDTVAFAVVYALDGKVSAVTRLNKVIHHPHEDKERLEKAGGVILYGRVQGVNGSLALSRAMGDFEYSTLGVCDDASIDISHITAIAPDPEAKCKLLLPVTGLRIQPQSPP